VFLDYSGTSVYPGSANNTPMWHVRYKPHNSKGKGYDRGHRISEVDCRCGKLCTTRLGYYQHLQAKHPKELRQMKKSGAWEQLEYDWPYDREEPRLP
jgi:hypothetical protein